MLPRFFSDIVNGVWAMEKSHADAYIPWLTSMLEGKLSPVETQIIQTGDKTTDFREENKYRENLRYFSESNDIYAVSEYGYANPPEEAPKNSIAIINLVDVVTKYDNACGPSGTQTKADLIQRIDANSNIKGLIINADTPGGEAYAAMHLAEVIKKIETPSLSFVNDLSASAGVLITSATDWVVANSKLAQYGSIGTYTTIADYEDFYKNHGIRLIEIYADKSHDKNKSHKDALKGDFTLIKEKINLINQNFLDTVAANRGTKLNGDEEVWGTGKLYNAEEAESIGLIDEIATWEQTLESFAEYLNI